MALRYEGVRYSDGSIAVRRISADPCERSSRTFESLRELEDDIGSADVTWLADAQTVRKEIGRGPGISYPTDTGLFAGFNLFGPEPERLARRCALCGVPTHGLIGAYQSTDGKHYCSKEHHDVGRCQPHHHPGYEPEEEADEP